MTRESEEDFGLFSFPQNRHNRTWGRQQALAFSGSEVNLQQLNNSKGSQYAGRIGLLQKASSHRIKEFN